MRTLGLACLFAATILTATTSGAQAPAAPSNAESGVTTLKVNTRLTLVDVTVADAKGNPVHGLTQADFRVKEDGKPQPIKNFEAIDSQKRTRPALPANVYTNRPGPSAQAYDILLLDQVSTGITTGLQSNPDLLKVSKDGSAKFLETMPDGTQVAILTMDGTGLHMVQGFTSNRQRLQAALQSVTYQRVSLSNWDPPQAPGLAGLPAEKPNYTLLCNATNFQSAQALNALNQLALFVASSPGRKNLFWFTPGIPWLTDYLPFSRSQNLMCLSDFTKELQQVYGRLTASRVAIYPIDPRGVPFNRAYTDNLSLDGLAKATGGKAHYGNNDLAGILRDDAAIGADYYALSYVPPLSGYDGKYHTIEIAVDRPGLHLEYRRGYTSLDLNGPLRTAEKGKTSPPADAFHAAMDFGGQSPTQIAFAVRALPSAGPQAAGVIGSLHPELKGKPLVRYSFDFDLPRDKITLQAQPDGSRKASFELMIAAYDIQGRRLNSLDEKRSLTLKADAVAAFLQKPFVVPVQIDLPLGVLTVRAGALDLPSQAMGLVEIPLNVAK